ncbi:MAG: peptidylprolyl isomerase [Bacteroidales bacterium]|nr:peptidylprolyl isomerase [Bacteroidales bacterium]
MKKNNFFILTWFLILVFSISFAQKNTKYNIVVIETDYGKIKIRLYNETPKHRDNFIKLVKEKFYDSLLFHRVIKDFMIQGGDPDSKRAKQSQILGNGGPGYTIEAEIVPNLFHKRGAVAAARLPDIINPKKESSGSQFYIVQGKIFTEKELNDLENRINERKKGAILDELLQKPEYESLKAKRDSISKTNDYQAWQKFINDVMPLLNQELEKRGKFKFSEEQKKIYTTIGGAPHLDGDYTVFGEVIEGMDVVDKIASVETDPNNRPRKDIRMLRVYLQK